jgi:hypothetical protein
MVVKSILRCPLLRHHFLAVAAFIDQPGWRGRLVEVLPSSKPAAIIATPASAIVGPAFRELATAPAAIGPSPCPVMIPVLLRPNASGSFRAIRILIRLWGRGTRSDLGFLGVSAATESSNSV